MNDSAPGGFTHILSDFGPLQKVCLFLGFTVFCVGMPKGFAINNRALMVGIALMAAGIAGRYWTTCRYADLYVDGETHRGGLKVGAVFLGMAFSALCVASGILAYLSD